MTLTAQLAEHFSRLDYTDVPAEKAEEMKRLLLDHLGVALAGSRTDTGRLAGEFAAELAGAPQATVVGSGERVPAVHAAFANAISSHSIELDDVDDEALFHFGPPVMAAALATAELVGEGGRELITAALAGCEMMNRVSTATNPALRDRGFHTTPTCGVFGAAVAAGRLLRLTPEQMTSALGLAGGQASGLMEMYGPSMQKRLNPGPAARNGVTAALLAQRGFTGSDLIIEGQRGFAAAFSGHFDAERLMAGLGTDSPVPIEYKPYACARPIHNAIECALLIREQERRPAADLERITVYRHPAWADYHTNSKPRTYHEAQMSLPYSVAVAFVDGAALLDQYSTERLADELVGWLAERVTIVRDASLPRGVSCRMVAEFRDGGSATSQVDHPKGSLRNPLSTPELEAKFRLLAKPVIGPDRVEKVVTKVRGLDAVTDVRALTALLSA